MFNDDIVNYFQTKKGLSQRDPLSPMLISIVASMFSILVERIKEDVQIGGLIQHLVMLMILSFLWSMIYTKM